MRFLFWFGVMVGVGCLLIASCFCFGLLHSGLLNLGICSFRISLVFSFTV